MMPEVFRLSAKRRRVHEATTEAAADEPRSSNFDDFVLGYRDCAYESLRYLETAMLTDSKNGKTSDRRSLVDELREHLVEHEVDTARQRRRRLPSGSDDDEAASLAISPANMDDRHSSCQPQCRRLRHHVLPVSLHHRQHLSLHHPEEIHPVHSRKPEAGHIQVSSRKISETANTSGDSGCGDLVQDVDDAASAARGGENVQNEVRHYASLLSTLAVRDVRVERLLTELFQLMDADNAPVSSDN